MTEPIRLGGEYDVDVSGTDHSGRVVELAIKGSVAKPDAVEVTLNNGVTFQIPWSQYDNRTFLPSEIDDD